MNPYLSLVGAIIAEVIGTTALNLSEGFSNVLPSIVVIIGYGVSFYLLSLALEQLPVGTMYATWSGIGIVAIAIVGIVFFNERIDLAGVIGFGFIIAGVYLLNIVSNMSAH